MRLCILVILTLVFAGCGTVAPRTEREIALLRAEILDMGDQYGDLQSRHRRALADLAECRGEPIQDEWLEPGYSYYPEGEIIDGGFVHLGTPDCCDECSQIYTNQLPIGSSVLPVESPVRDTGTQPRLPVIDPIRTPFQESTDPAPRNRAPDQSLRPNRNRYLSRLAKSFSSRRGQGPLSMLSQRNRIPDAEPAFRPNEARWTQQANRAASQNDVADLDISYGTEAPQREASKMAWRKTSAARPQPLSSAPLDNRFLESDLVTRPSTQNASIKQILIDPENTFATDYDQDGSSDGIQVLIQALDANGAIVNQSAELVVSLIDPNEVGEAQRIGLWKYQAYQTESFVSTERGRLGLKLDLAWQRRTPKNRKLVLFVRYLTPDGKSLDTSLDIDISPSSGGDLEMNGPVAKRNTAGNSSGTDPGNAQPESANVPSWRPVR